MTNSNHEGSAATSLHRVKVVHPLVWAFFAVSILAIPVFAWARQ